VPAVPASMLLTSKDLDEIGETAFSAGDARTLAAALVEAAEQGRIADPADSGYALLLAAKITERAEDLAGALGLAQRAVAACQAGGDTECGLPRAFQAGLLLRTGREEEAITQLAALRPLLARDPDAAGYLSEALEAGGRTELAVEWLTTALEAALEARATLAGQQPEPAAYTEAVAVAFMLVQQRHRLRQNLGRPHDDYDLLADQLQAVAEELSADELSTDEEDSYEGRALLFWPAAEFDQLLARWPVLAETYGQSWDEHRTAVERGLVSWSESGLTDLGIQAGSAEGLAGYAERHGGDPTDLEFRMDYAQHVSDHHPRFTEWPPGRNEPCWCGSTGKYKKCCLPRPRS
jgi:SEC-C motif